MEIRKYWKEDIQEIAKLFYETVHFVNRKDYTQEQVDVWATGDMDEERWNDSLLENYSLVAVLDGQIVGFGDIDASGYLDRLYVHKNHQGIGVASAICDLLEENAGGLAISVHASVTAKPFFEKRGYKALKQQQVERDGILLTNFLMVKEGR